MGLKITLSGQTIVKPTALGPVANTDTKLLIYGVISKGPSFGTGRDGPESTSYGPLATPKAAFISTTRVASGEELKPTRRRLPDLPIHEISHMHIRNAVLEKGP